MAAMTLAQAREVLRELTFQDKLYLLNELTTQILQSSTMGAASQPIAHAPFPTFPAAHWPTDMPVHRSELYDDFGR